MRKDKISKDHSFILSMTLQSFFFAKPVLTFMSARRIFAGLVHSMISGKISMRGKLSLYKIGIIGDNDNILYCATGGRLMISQKLSRAARTERAELLCTISGVRRAIRDARALFAVTAEPELLEACVFEIKYLQARYSFLLRQARELGYEDLRILKEANAAAERKNFAGVPSSARG